MIFWIWFFFFHQNFWLFLFEPYFSIFKYFYIFFTRWPIEPKRPFWRAPALQTPPKFHEKTPRESIRSESSGGRKKKELEILLPPSPLLGRSGPALQAPPPFAPPHFFWVLGLHSFWAPTLLGSHLALNFCLVRPHSLLRVSLLLLLLLLLDRRLLKNPPLPLLTFQNVCVAFAVFCAVFFFFLPFFAVGTVFPVLLLFWCCLCCCLCNLMLLVRLFVVCVVFSFVSAACIVVSALLSLFCVLPLLLLFLLFVPLLVFLSLLLLLLLLLPLLLRLLLGRRLLKNPPLAAVLLLLLLLLDRRPLNPLPLLTFQNVKNYFTID